MNLGDSGNGGPAPGIGGGATNGCVSGGGNSSLHHHKKLRRKRKELDALVPEDKVRRKASSASRHDLLRHSDSDDIEFHGRGGDFAGLFGRGGLLGCLPGACALLVLLTTAVCVAAALRLLMATRKDLDAIQMRINAVEASGSELPAKFHECHVRLQQLGKNHTALWTTLNTVSDEVRDITQKVTYIESSLKALEDRLSGAPQLSALPKDVANIQESVVTFGSSLQDVQSALKALKNGQDALNIRVKSAGDNIKDVQSDILQLKNVTHLPSEFGREGVSMGEGISVVDAFLVLKGDVRGLTSSLTALNESVTSSLAGSLHHEDTAQTLRSHLGASIGNLSDEVNLLENFYTKMEKENLGSRLANISSDLTFLKRVCSDQGTQIQNINQSIAVVKGVERKLEGSQVHMASGVSEIKQRLQKLEEELRSLTPPSTTVSSGQTSEDRAREKRETREDMQKGAEDKYFFKIRRKKSRP